jgi:hypothetical protein
MKKQLNLLIFKEDGWWIAQCLDYDIAAQARTLPDVQYEIQRVLVGRISMAKKLSIDPFEGLAPAPEGYLKMFKDTNKSFKLEMKPVRRFSRKIVSQSFTFPKQAMLYAA